MNSPKNAKGMLVVLAVLCAGAGSYWFFGGGENGTNTDSADGVVERRPPVAPDTVKPQPNRPKVADSAESEQASPRKPRPDPPDSDFQKNSRAKPDKAAQKKPIRYAA